MAKVKDIKKGFGLKKKPIITEEKSEEIVDKVHAAPKKTERKAKKRGRKKINTEKTVRYTIDIPESIYKALRHQVVDEGGTMKAFIMKTLKKELKIK